MNTNGDADNYSIQVCNGFGPARTFTSALPNLDGDAFGDCTDDDIDGDGVQNAADNCVFAPNAGQQDSDGNGIGNACQDTDRDLRLDVVDNCPVMVNPDQRDFDADGLGNLCDPDADGDGLLNGADNCPFASNADQADANGDGFGDVCDVVSMRFIVERSNQNYPTSLKFSINGTQVGALPPMPAATSARCDPPAEILTIADPDGCR